MNLDAIAFDDAKAINLKYAAAYERLGHPKGSNLWEAWIRLHDEIGVSLSPGDLFEALLADDHLIERLTREQWRTIDAISETIAGTYRVAVDLWVENCPVGEYSYWVAISPR